MSENNFENSLISYLSSDQYNKDISRVVKKGKAEKGTVRFLDDVFAGKYQSKAEFVRLILNLKQFKKIPSIKRANVEAKLRATDFFSDLGIINPSVADDSKVSELTKLLILMFKRGVNIGRADVRKKLRVGVQKKKRSSKRKKK